MSEYDYNLLFRKYLKTISNLETPNPKLYVTFSAVPGSGKTTISRHIAYALKGLHLRTDDVRKVAKELWPDIADDQLEKVILEFTPTIHNRLIDYPNGLHIVDTNIDRYYQKVFDKAKELDFRLYLIRIDLDKETLLSRIKKRAGHNKKEYMNFLNVIEEKLRQHQDFIDLNKEKVSYWYKEGKTSLDDLVEDIRKVLSDS